MCGIQTGRGLASKAFLSFSKCDQGFMRLEVYLKVKMTALMWLAVTLWLVCLFSWGLAIYFAQRVD